MREVAFHPDAAAEYQGSLVWYAQRNPVAAARFESEVEQALAASARPPSGSRSSMTFTA